MGSMPVALPVMDAAASSLQQPEALELPEHLLSRPTFIYARTITTRTLGGSVI